MAGIRCDSLEFSMKYILPFLLLSACTAGGQSISPIQSLGFRNVSTFEGSGRFGSLEVGTLPMTFPVKWWGAGTATIQFPQKPYFALDGDATLVVEPITPDRRAELERSMANGYFSVRRDGAYVGLSPAGSIP